jgi:hypothetical protein
MAKSKISKKKSVSVEGIMSFDSNGKLTFEVEGFDSSVSFQSLVDNEFDGLTVKVTCAVAEDI